MQQVVHSPEYHILRVSPGDLKYFVITRSTCRSPPEGPYGVEKDPEGSVKNVCAPGARCLSYTTAGSIGSLSAPDSR